MFRVNFQVNDLRVRVLINLEMEHSTPLDEQFLVNYNDLCQLLKGEFGLELLSSIDLLELAMELTQILEQLVSLSVSVELTMNRRLQMRRESSLKKSL